MLELLAAALAAQPGRPRNTCNCRVQVIDDEAGNAFVNDLRHRAAAEANYGSATSHGFNHGQSKRFRPVNRKQQRNGIAQKTCLLNLGDFTDEVNLGAIDQAGHLRDVVFVIDAIDLGRDLQWNLAAARYLDRALDALFRGDAAEEGQ